MGWVRGMGVCVGGGMGEGACACITTSALHAARTERVHSVCWCWCLCVRWVGGWVGWGRGEAWGGGVWKLRLVPVCARA